MTTMTREIFYRTYRSRDDGQQVGPHKKRQTRPKPKQVEATNHHGRTRQETATTAPIGSGRPEEEEGCLVDAAACGR